MTALEKRTKPEPSCYMVGREDMEKYWRDVYGPMIARALAESPQEESLDDIRENLHCDSMLINISLDGEIMAVAVLDIVMVRLERLLHVHTLTGARMVQWLPEFVEYLVYLNGALELDGISLTGRAGWQRILARLGFKTKFVIMRHEG